jgi:hypothetical protein
VGAGGSWEMRKATPRAPRGRRAPGAGAGAGLFSVLCLCSLFSAAVCSARCAVRGARCVLSALLCVRSECECVTTAVRSAGSALLVAWLAVHCWWLVATTPRLAGGSRLSRLAAEGAGGGRRRRRQTAAHQAKEPTRPGFRPSREAAVN